MNIKNSIFIIACAFTMHSYADETYTYQEEFKILKDSEQYKAIFDKEQSPLIRQLRRNIENARGTIKPTTLSKQLNIGIIITPENMPKLYTFIKTICAAHSIEMPLILLSTEGEIYNAFATKIFWAKGIVYIGRELLLDLSDDALEGALAHELGHIKYNHANKSLAISISGAIASGIIADYIVKHYFNENNNFLRDFIIGYTLSATITSLLIGKKFVKEADTFACKDVGKANGLIKLFTKFQEKNTHIKEAWIETKNLLDADKETMAEADYNDILVNYYFSKGIQNFSDALRWIYHNTPFGPHPSHEARIEAAQKR